MLRFFTSTSYHRHRHLDHLHFMTTLTVYFALSPTSLSSIQTFPMISIPRKPIALPSITLCDPPLSAPIQRKLSKRNKTFFERFEQTSPIPKITKSLSQSQQQTNDLPIDPSAQLRRRFTFRRSFRRSPREQEVDIDDGVRLALFLH